MFWSFTSFFFLLAAAAMARSYYKKRRYSVKKRPSRKREYSAMAKANKALRILAKRRPERKQVTTIVDEYINFNGAASAGAINIGYPEEGVQRDDRVGREIQITSCVCRLRVLPSATTAQTETMRVALVVDHEANLPNCADYLPSTGSAQAPQSQWSLANRGLFTVLKDAVVPIVNLSSTWRGGVLHWSVPLDAMRSFLGNGTSLPKTNRLRLVAVNADSGTLGANSAILTGTVALNYIDT